MVSPLPSFPRRHSNCNYEGKEVLVVENIFLKRPCDHNNVRENVIFLGVTHAEASFWVEGKSSS